MATHHQKQTESTYVQSVKCLFELFHHLKDLEWGKRQQAQQVDTKHENCIEISNVDAVKEMQIFSTYLGIKNIQRMWIQYMEFFQLQILAWGWLYNILNFEIFAPCAQQIGPKK